jgi:hypothetical protein
VPRWRSRWTHCLGGDARCRRTGALLHRRRTAHARLQAMDGSSSAVRSAAPRSFGPQPGGFRSLHGRRVWPGASCHFLHGRWHGAHRPRDRSFISLAALLFDVAIIVYWCCNNILGMLQLFVFTMKSFLVYVANRRACVASVFLACCECLVRMFQN